MALVYGGGAYQLFCPTIFKYLHGIEAYQLIATIREVPDQSVRDTLLEVSYSHFFSCIISYA